MIQLGTTTTPMARAWVGKRSAELSVTMRTLEGRWPATAGYLPVVDPLIPCPLCPLAPVALCRGDSTWGAGALVIQGHPASARQGRPDSTPGEDLAQERGASTPWRREHNQSDCAMAAAAQIGDRAYGQVCRQPCTQCTILEERRTNGGSVALLRGRASLPGWARVHDEVAAQPQLPCDGEDAAQPLHLLRGARRHHEIDGERAPRREQRGELAQKRRGQRSRREPARLEEIEADEVECSRRAQRVFRQPGEGIPLDDLQPGQTIERKRLAGHDQHLGVALDADQRRVWAAPCQQLRDCPRAQPQQQRAAWAAGRQE